MCACGSVDGKLDILASSGIDGNIYMTFSLQYWYENGHLPEFQRYYELEDVADIKAPRYRDPELLPGWYEAYFSTKKQIEVCLKDASYRRNYYCLTAVLVGINSLQIFY